MAGEQEWGVLGLYRINHFRDGAVNHVELIHDMQVVSIFIAPHLGNDAAEWLQVEVQRDVDRQVGAEGWLERFVSFGIIGYKEWVFGFFLHLPIALYESLVLVLRHIVAQGFEVVLRDVGVVGNLGGDVGPGGGKVVLLPFVVHKFLHPIIAWVATAHHHDGRSAFGIEPRTGTLKHLVEQAFLALVDFVNPRTIDFKAFEAVKVFIGVVVLAHKEQLGSVLEGHNLALLVPPGNVRPKPLVHQGCEGDQSGSLKRGHTLPDNHPPGAGVFRTKRDEG